MRNISSVLHSDGSISLWIGEDTDRIEEVYVIELINQILGNCGIEELAELKGSFNTCLKLIDMELNFQRINNKK